MWYDKNNQRCRTASRKRRRSYNDGINIYAPGEKVTVAMKPTDVMSYDAQ